jgi:hypothetical protein
MTVNREHETQTGLIDLGAASAETRGPPGIFIEEILTRYVEGLSDDRPEIRVTGR